jgi:hypothetical protein
LQPNLVRSVKPSCTEIRLRELMSEPDGWGIEQGRQVYRKLLACVDAHPTSIVFRISLARVKRTDVSFPRESVVELAARFRGQKGFYLRDVNGESLLENWDAAANRREQPLFVWVDKTPRLLGPEPPRTVKDVLAFALQHDFVTTARVAGQFGLSSSNASNKLRTLSDMGYLLRKEEAAPTGGLEYVYHRVR